tara:strand:+ start:98 stop:277 length:180 start_codon:yes stop_codon:yes gene_type:complete
MNNVQILEDRIREIKEHLTELNLVQNESVVLTDSIVYWERTLEQKSVELQHQLRIRYDS